jgi:hypothetical protein
MKRNSFAVKLLVFMITIVLFVPIVQNYEILTVDAATATSVYSQGFESNMSGWYAAYEGTIFSTASVKHSGSKSLMYTGRSQSWHSPAMNVYNMIKAGGAGV